MIAVINTAGTCSWAAQLGAAPWALLPVANRPLLDYWMESCAELGVEKVHVVLGEGAKSIEDLVGSGSRWNVAVEYGFARAGESPQDYLRIMSRNWNDGIFYLGGPFFLRRRQAFRPAGLKKLATCRHDADGEMLFLCAKTHEEAGMLINEGEGSAHALERIHVHPYVINSINAYFELNMKMVKAEFSRYVTAGFSSADNSSLGYNVRTPPSSHLRAPILVGDDCRFGVMSTIGPNAVISNHVIVDAYSELTDCLILNDTYIGRNLEIRNKIVSGNRVVDPSDGTVVKIDDSWLIARNRPALRTEDVVRYVILWFVALGLAVVQFLPFCILFPLVLMTRIAEYSSTTFHDPHAGYITLPVFKKRRNRKSILYRLFRALSLDRFPWILQVLRGKMFLCGQPPMRHPQDDKLIKQLPHYYPGVFCYQDYTRDSDRLTDSLWYAHIRSLFEDLKILIKTLAIRLLGMGRSAPSDCLSD